jgi:hypothetical protein
MFEKGQLFVIIFVSIFGFSCKKDEGTKKQLVIPTVYNSSLFQINTTKETSILNQIEAVVGEIEKCQSPARTTTYPTLLNLYNIENPILTQIGSAEFDGKIQSPNGWLYKASLASGKSYSPIDSNGNGGVYGGYLFDENGLDMAELVEKTMFGSVIYKHGTDLMAGTITTATVDQLIAILGSNPGFPNTSSSKVPKPDVFMAKYVARRDKNDGSGFYSQLKTNFFKLQAAVQGGSDFYKERDEAIVAIRQVWEKAMAATVVNYCKTVQSTLSNTNLTEAQKASALHSLTEAIGFTYGLKGVATGRKVISDDQIKQLLVLFNYSETGKSTCYRFALQPEKELPKLEQAVSLIKSIYGFTDQEISDFSKNWINEQGR